MFKENEVSFGAWILAGLIMAIPIVNIVMIFIFAFGNGYNKTFANYYKAQLVIFAVVFVLYLLVGAAFLSSFAF